MNFERSFKRFLRKKKNIIKKKSIVGMKALNFKVSTLEGLCDILNSKELNTIKHKSLLVQIFSAKNDSRWFISLGNRIKERFPSAIVVGASSVGEICEGKMFTNTTIVCFSFFETSTLNLLSYECKAGKELEIGKEIANKVKFINPEVKGLLLLTTPVSIDSSTLFNSLAEQNITYPIFGGGAGDYANKRKTLIFDGSKCYNKGVVAIALSGKTLNIVPLTYLGWHPLSKEMTLTKVDGMSVKTIDNLPAFSIYEKYLGIKIDDDFFQNVLEFPFLIQREGQTIARVPFFVNKEDKSIEFFADIKEGEKFKIGYGNPNTIINDSIHIQNQIKEFQPEAIFLYTCICRRFLMQDDVEFETLPFNSIAPTSGFYTFGEFYASNDYKSPLNSTMVAVGFRETTKKEKHNEDKLSSASQNIYLNDPFQKQHARILSRLLFFINEMTNELEAQNRQLKLLNDQKNELLGIAAHDLRNPIGIIQGFSEILEEKIDDEYKDYTKIITHVSSEMLNLLNDFLDISKINAGKLDLKKKAVDYIPLVNENVKMNRMLASNKDISIELEFAMPSQIITIDSGKIVQVLNNLIGNAIKYSNRNTNILVKVYKLDNQIITKVIDKGLGIPENEIKDIFHPFKKASTKPTEGEASHGLGLAIVKKIVEHHNGKIKVTSTLGKGSTFSFSLPIE